MKLRFAEAGDIPECIEIGREFWEKSPYKDEIAYNALAVDNLLGSLVENKLMVIAEYEEGIVAVAAIFLAPMPFNPLITIARELFWYVKPGLREHGIGGALLSNLESLARAKGASMFSMGTMQTSDPEQAARKLTDNGYAQTESVYTKVL